MDQLTDSIRPVRKSKILRYWNSQYGYKNDILAAEEPLEIRLNCQGSASKLHKPFMISLRTPGHDLDLITGLLYSEGLIDSIDDIVAIDFPSSFQASVTLKNKKPQEHHSRTHTSNSACGACGKSEIKMLGIDRLDKLSVRERFCHLELDRVYEKLSNTSSLFSQTGGIHGAFLINPTDSNVLCTREDIGRHNAVDKVIGAALRNPDTQALLNRKSLAISSRIGFEIVQKAANARIPVIIALGAASSLAVEIADELNICLVGFLSSKKHNIYTHSFRLLKDATNISATP
ncbi:MAG: formate dehydrogenase accessory sulfurtransferase FdhD [Verrucomicrobiota bacterium]